MPELKRKRVWRDGRGRVKHPETWERDPEAQGMADIQSEMGRIPHRRRHGETRTQVGRTRGAGVEEGERSCFH